MKNEFLRPVFDRLGKLKFILLSAGLLSAAFFFYYRAKRNVIYTASATVFPLTNSGDNNSVASTLTSLLGVNEMPQSFSQEASINIVELAQSRFTREAVALVRLPKFNNATIAELLINNYNQSRLFFARALNLPQDSARLASAGALLLEDNLTARINKNGILEINFSCNNKELVSPISYAVVEKVSEFYKELKIRKAKEDFDFTQQKVDSLHDILDEFDSKAIGLSNRTLFVAPDRLQYQLPKENIGIDKQRVSRQYDAAINNREEALWRLQKVTPVIAILDKPDEPFDEKNPWGLLFAVIGFFIGVVMLSVLLIIDIFFRYVIRDIRENVM